jgi:LysM repeat protein
MSVAWLSRFAILLACLGLAGCFPPEQGKLDENKNPYLLEGKARVAARDYKGAIEAFEKALEVHPRSALAHFEVAMLYEQHSEQTERDYINAMYHYQQVLKLRPPGVYPHDNAKVRIASCKQELVKAESLAPVYYAMDRELQRLKQENQDLRTQLDGLQTQTPRLAQSQPTYVVTPPPTPNPTAPERLAFAGSASAAPELKSASRVYKQHVVKPNETLASIARTYRVRVENIMAANPSLEPKRLKAGQTIKIPAS